MSYRNLPPCCHVAIPGSRAPNRQVTSEVEEPDPSPELVPELPPAVLLEELEELLEELDELEELEELEELLEELEELLEDLEELLEEPDPSPDLVPELPPAVLLLDFLPAAQFQLLSPAQDSLKSPAAGSSLTSLLPHFLPSPPS